MYTDNDKIEKAITVLTKMAKGINPLTGEQVEDSSFLNDGRIVRCLYFVSEVLENVKNNVYSINKNRPKEFVITEEQKERVQFPEKEIGVNEFSKCINQCIDLTKSKHLTGVELNKKLKKLGILSEETSADGKTKTIVNGRSMEYGFDTISREYNGVKYDQVVMNDRGKKYLLDNLMEIMNAD